MSQHLFFYALALTVCSYQKCGFETVVYRNATNKAKYLIDICKAKIIVFRGATAFANACTNARIFGRCCYLMPAYLLRKVPIETNVINYETICLTETECHLLAIWKIARAWVKFTSFFAKLGLQCCFVRFANGLGNLGEQINVGLLTIFMSVDDFNDLT